MYSNANAIPGAWKKWSYLGAQREGRKCVAEEKRAPVTWRVNKEMNCNRRWEPVGWQGNSAAGWSSARGSLPGMREEVGGGIWGTWVEHAGAWPEQHFLTWKKIIQILGRIAQCKCSYKSYTLNNVGGNGGWTVPVSSKVRDDGGFLSHSTFGLVLIFKSVNTCHLCYSDLLKLWVKIMEGHLTFSYVWCPGKDLRSTMHSSFQMLNRFMCVECEPSCS